MNVLRSEWTKLRTLRSSSYTLLITIVLSVGIGSVITFGQAKVFHTASAADRALFDPTAMSMQGALLAQLAVGAMGVLVITSEYATGMVVTSLTAVPGRVRLLVTKAVVFTACAVTAGVIVGFGAFLAGQPILAWKHAPHAALDQPGVLRAVVGMGLYLALVGLLGLAVGTLVRATGGALTLVTALTLLIPVIANTLPDAWKRGFGEYWPTSAGFQIMATRHDPATALPPWPGFALMCLFVAALLAAAFAVFRARDV